MDKYLITHIEDEYGDQFIYRFDNDYGASVIRNIYRSGCNMGLWELACIVFVDDEEYEISNNNGLIDDIVGYLNWKEVEELLNMMKNMQIN